MEYSENTESISYEIMATKKKATHLGHRENI